MMVCVIDNDEAALCMLVDINKVRLNVLHDLVLGPTRFLALLIYKGEVDH